MCSPNQPQASQPLTSAIEMALVIAGCVLLWQVAQGLGGSGRVEWTFKFWRQTFPVELAGRAEWLNDQAGPALAIVGICGWLALWLGRLRMALSARLAAILGVWLLAGVATAAGVGRVVMPSSPLILMLSGLAGLYSAWAATHSKTATWFSVSTRSLSVWVYPGWLLFGGLGVLWLLDYAARGYPKYRYIGLYQFDAWLLATALFSFVAACAPVVLARMSRLLGRIEAGAGKGLPLILAILAVWMVLVTGGALLLASGNRPVALITEALRLAAWSGMAWFTYRWVGTGLRPVIGLLAAASLLILLLLALLLLKDRGPILVQAIAMSLVLGSLIMVPLRRRLPPHRATLAASAVVMSLLAGIVWGVYQLAPQWRTEAVAHPHQGRLEYLSETRWFIHGSPETGYGLGNVPWCGNTGSLGLTGCAGVPQQIQSDYVFAALSGVWGAVPATLLILLLLAWLALLIRSRFSQASARAVDLNTLAGWLIAAGALTYASQIIVSSLGTLGTIPLTGVSIPLLAYGGTSLFTLALLAGLAINRFPHPAT